MKLLACTMMCAVTGMSVCSDANGVFEPMAVRLLNSMRISVPAVSCVSPHSIMPKTFIPEPPLNSASVFGIQLPPTNSVASLKILPHSASHPLSVRMFSTAVPRLSENDFHEIWLEKLNILKTNCEETTEEFDKTLPAGELPIKPITTDVRKTWEELGRYPQLKNSVRKGKMGEFFMDGYLMWLRRLEEYEDKGINVAPLEKTKGNMLDLYKAYNKIFP